MVQDLVSGMIAAARKEELILEIEHQSKLGDAGKLEKNKYLANVNLEMEKMESSSGEQQHYWLLAKQTAQNGKKLQEQWESQSTASGNTTRE